MKTTHISSMVIVLVAGWWLYKKPSGSSPGTLESRAEFSYDSRMVLRSVRAERAGNFGGAGSGELPRGGSVGPGAEALELLQQLRSALKSPDVAAQESPIPNLLSRLLDIAPEDAARLVDSALPEEWREQILLRVAGGWASRDVKAALAWATSLPDSPERHDALVEIALQASRMDPSAAAHIALEHGLDSESQPILPLLCQIWAENNIGEVLAWSQNHAGRLPYGEIVARIAFVQSETDPAEAARLVALRIEPGPIQDEAVMSVLHQWALRDSHAPLKWVEEFAEGELKERALAELSGGPAQL